jgi:SIR2-like domain
MKSESQFTEEDWRTLITRIGDGRCTPFLGAGVAHGILPLGGDVARELAREYGYPFAESADDLIRVSQYVALNHDPMYVKQKLAKTFGRAQLPGRKEMPGEPHRMLAKLPLPLYITTNYDDLLMQALAERYKKPERELCRWSEAIHDSLPSVFDAGRTPPYSPHPATPLVFHLHGHAGVVESLVITEDDYLEFLFNLSANRRLLPPPVARALGATALLFIGYRVADWNFRVILRGVARAGFENILVMPAPDDGAEKEKIQAYLARYYGKLDIRVYWGTAASFLRALLEHAGDSFD